MNTEAADEDFVTGPAMLIVLFLGGLAAIVVILFHLFG